LSQRYLVVGARLDNVGFHTLTVDGRPVPQICPGANGNASGLAMLVELARMVHTQSLRFRRSVLFVAFGASGQGFAGAWYFMDRSFPDADRIDAMVNLDGVGFGRNGFYAYTSSNADLNALLGEVNATLQPVRPEIVAAEPYPSDHRVFYSREVPSVLFSTGRYPEFNTARDVPSALDYEGMERETEYVFNFLSALACKGEAPRFLPGREEEVRLPGRISFYDCDEKPRFFGSSDLGNFLRKWVYQYLRYPHAAVEQGIQGRVTLSFTIDERGKVRDVQVTRGAHELLDAEAVRVVQASPDWTPGKIRGKRVAATVSVPVDFRLERTGGKHKLGIKR
jgi:TonB family protein